MHGSCTEVLHSSYTMGTCGLPDIYTLSPWASGIYRIVQNFDGGNFDVFVTFQLDHQNLTRQIV